MSFTRVAIYAPSPSTTRGQSTKISASKDKIVYTNGRAVFVSCETLPSVAAEAQRSCLALDTRYLCRCPSTRTHSFTAFIDPIRTLHSVCRTAAMFNTRPSHAYLQRATTVLLLTRLELVRVDFSMTAGSFYLFHDPVRIWDIVGEDQVLKGEYKALTGRMCGLLYFCDTASL